MSQGRIRSHVSVLVCYEKTTHFISPVRRLLSLQGLVHLDQKYPLSKDINILTRKYRTDLPVCTLQSVSLRLIANETKSDPLNFSTAHTEQRNRSVVTDFSIKELRSPRVLFGHTAISDCLKSRYEIWMNATVAELTEQ